MPDPGTTIKTINLAVSILKPLQPTLWNTAKIAFTGKKLLLLGGQDTGKTTFYNYLYECELRDEEGDSKTYVYETEIKEPGFIYNLGDKGLLQLIVKTSKEIPGQSGPFIQAAKVIENNPDGVIVFLDMSKPNESLQWVKNFCGELEQIAFNNRHNNPLNPVLFNLQSFIFVMNKKDKMQITDDIESWRKKISNIIDTLKEGKGQLRKNQIKIEPCILITNPDGTKYVDKIIVQIARDFKK